jgi:hypothetical protein
MSEEDFARGYESAMDTVFDVISEMEESMNFHNPTLEELEQRLS